MPNEKEDTVKTPKISISDNNTKMGNIPSFSLTPGKTCSSIACRTCLKDCYAMKAYRQYPATKNAYDRNTEAMINNRQEAFKQIEAYLKKKKPVFFRIHVAGDFFSLDYLLDWIDIAVKFPETSFLAFTKQYHLFNYRNIPENLQIIFSAWPGQYMPSTDFPIAWMQDGTEDRTTGKELPCPGKCDTCGMCFKLSKTGHDVVFNKH